MSALQSYDTSYTIVLLLVKVPQRSHFHCYVHVLLGDHYYCYKKIDLIPNHEYVTLLQPKLGQIKIPNFVTVKKSLQSSVCSFTKH